MAREGPPLRLRTALGRLWDTVKAILKEADDDRIVAEAAHAAFFFFLSFFPMVLTLFAATGLIGGDSAFDWVMEQLRASLPSVTAEQLGELVAEVTGEERPTLLSFSIVLTLWTASTLFAALTDGLNRMYDIDEARGWFRRRGIATVALVVSIVSLSAGATVLLAGPEIASYLRVGIVWRVLSFPLVFFLVVAMIWLLLIVLPNRDQRRANRWIAIGAVVGATLWVVATLLFRLYVTSIGRYSATYGFVGGVMVLLLWLYLTTMAVLFAGEVAATLEQRSRHSRSERAG